MEIATKVLFVVPHSQQIRFASIGLLFAEEEHVIFKCLLSVSLQTGSSLIIILMLFCVSINTNEAVWIDTKKFSGGFAVLTDFPNSKVPDEVLYYEICWKKSFSEKVNILSRRVLN